MDAWKDESACGVGTLRVGIVKHLYVSECAVEVHLPDVDDGEFVTFKLPVLQHGSGNKARSWWMPAIDDQVLVCFLPYAKDFGFVVGSFYAPSDSKPTENAEDYSVTFENGDYLSYKPSDRTFEVKVNETHVKVSDGLVEAGNGSEVYVALAPDVDTQLKGIKAALDAIQQAFNTHTHTVEKIPGSDAALIVAAAASGTAAELAGTLTLTPLAPSAHTYTVGNVAASHVKAD